MYKISRYNIIKKYDDKIIVYNSYTKANIFLSIDSSTKAFEDIKEFEKLDNDTKKLLIDNGFYANNILGLGEDLAVRNSTNKPVINEEENSSMFEEQIYEDIQRMSNDGLKRIAIITRNKKEADELFIG